MNASKLASIPLLERLVSFDTTSRNSNLALIDFVRDYLSGFGVDSELSFDDNREKANLYATLGPDDRPGIVLSGHTDVVPVDGQDWQSDPFRLVERDGQLYGRGTCDMKGFIAIALALVPEMLESGLRTPIHLAFSYDEEIGCLGVRRLLAKLEQAPVKPSGCIIGEPTSLRVVRAHKGKLSLRCRVRGLECHSSIAHEGVNAVEAAAQIVTHLKHLAQHFQDQGPFDPKFCPPYTTVHTGVIQGGTALNIVPKDCWFDFEFRHLPGDDPEALLAEVRRFAELKILPEMHAVSEKTDLSWERLSQFPGLSTDENAEVVRLLKALTDTEETGKVSFGTEGGLFQQIGVPAVVCGPGSIEQAHKPNESIALAQLADCEALVRRLIARLAQA